MPDDAMELEYGDMLLNCDGVKSSAWYYLALKGWSKEEIRYASKGCWHPSDISHAVRQYAKRHCLPVPISCEERYERLSSGPSVCLSRESFIAEIRSAEAAAREEEWKAIRGGLNMAKSHERNDKAVIHNGAIGLALQIVNAREDIVRNVLAGEEGEG